MGTVELGVEQHRGEVGMRIVRQHPDRAAGNVPGNHGGGIAAAAGQHRLDGNPFVVGQFVAHDSAPSVRGLNHGSAVRLNGAATDGDLVAIRPEADALCSL